MTSSSPLRGRIQNPIKRSKGRIAGSRSKGRIAAGLVGSIGLVAALCLGAGTTTAALSSAQSNQQLSPQALTVTLKWERLLGDNTQIVESSPTLATLDNDGSSIVVGSRGNGCVYAVHLANGSTTPGWPQCTDAGIDSTPSVYPSSDGLDNVYVSTGDTPGEEPPVYNETCGSDEANCIGALYAFGPSGNTIWSRYLPDKFGGEGAHPPIFASPTIGALGNGSPEIVVGGISQSLYAINPTNGATEPGWPQKTADTTFATASIANVNNTQQIVAASDSTAGPGALNNWNGGSVRLMNANGGTLWTAQSNEVVTSSPVVGNLDGAGPVAVYGHGHYWGSSDDTGLTADNATNGAKEWEEYLNGYTRATPALADLLGNDQLDVVEPTWTATGSTTGGAVYAFNPIGQKLWGPVTPGNTTIAGSVATADFGGGYQDVVAATGLGWYIIDGRSGSLYPANGLNITWPGQTPANLAMSNSPLVVADPSGNGVDVIVAGSYAGTGGDNTQGFIADYQVTGGSNSVGANAWPEFHHDPQLTGSTIATAAPPVPPGTCNPDVPPCSIEGYQLDASDGGIFAFGTATYAGSMGGKPLAKPVVGMAEAPNDGGYWEVASDGGIFSFGSALFHGSMGGKHLTAPIVGMASTPNGGGYWEVASDGGIFAFGDAQFYGSMGGKHLNKPIVGMAVAPGGDGYWLVASDGGIFSFGPGAHFDGSMGGKHLNDPIVGMASDPTGAGYWEVASDGGIFSFGPHFYGSTGAMRLVKPVVGMSSTSDGDGYWLVAADGGIFSFGDAFFRGSTGNMVLHKPVVGMSGTG
ncbi:MAG: hypothetical protein WAM97_21110 [Acidimicrobiales bacterium]